MIYGILAYFKILTSLPTCCVHALSEIGKGDPLILMPGITYYPLLVVQIFFHGRGEGWKPLHSCLIK